jgi:predicted secreted Zn-dependent protease
MRNLLPLCAMSLALCSTFVSAQIHMCKGADGRKVYSDVPCGPDATVVDVRPSGGGTSINPGANVQTEHYDIHGTTWEELRSQIASLGPEGFWGSTQSGVGYSLRARPGPNGCAVVPESVKATSEARIRLPNWRERHAGSPQLQSYWDNVYRSLDLHERGHVRINFDGAQEMERALHALPPQPTCDTVEGEAKRRAAAVMAEVARRQADYDRETDHGRRQWTPYRD